MKKEKIPGSYQRAEEAVEYERDNDNCRWWPETWSGVGNAAGGINREKNRDHLDHSIKIR